MNNDLILDIRESLDDLASLLPPESQAAFIAAFQNLARMPLPANRDLATVFVCAAWTITQRGGLKALPEIARTMEKVIQQTVTNAIEDSVKRTVKDAVRGMKRIPPAGFFSPVPKELTTAIRNGPEDPLYQEIAARVRAAWDAELQQRLSQIKQEQAALAKRSKIQSWTIGLLMAFVVVIFTGTLELARNAAEARGFAAGEKKFAEDVGIREDAVKLIQDKDTRKLLSDSELQGVRQALLNKDVLPALLDPDFRIVLSAQADAKSTKEKRELIDAYKLVIRCHQLGVRLYLANPIEYREVLPPNCFALGIYRALIDKQSISQNQDDYFTLIPFQPAAPTKK